jgi:hypothetical protein
MNERSFPPSTPPADKAKYRQFLIDHALDPNLTPEDLARELATKSSLEREQIEAHWGEFLQAL